MLEVGLFLILMTYLASRTLEDLVSKAYQDKHNNLESGLELPDKDESDEGDWPDDSD